MRDRIELNDVEMPIYAKICVLRRYDWTRLRGFRRQLRISDRNIAQALYSFYIDTKLISGYSRGSLQTRCQTTALCRKSTIFQWLNSVAMLLEPLEIRPKSSYERTTRT